MGRNSTTEPSGVSPEALLTCPECGSCSVETSNEQYSFPYGVGDQAVELTARVPVRKCADCGFRYMDRSAERICHDVICDHLRVMKPSQVKGLRNLYDLSQCEFSRITGLGEATLSRWERGIVIQNQAYDNYLYLLGFKNNIRRIQERKSLGTSYEHLEPKMHKLSFPSLDVTEELLKRQSRFNLRLWQVVGER